MKFTGHFLQLLYGKNVARGIDMACHEPVMFDQRFERAQQMSPP